jgi:hypothetical protein
LIDADALILAIATAGQDNKGGRYVVGDIWELNFQEIREVINNAPTVDAVPVVRCGECKWFDRTELSGTVEPIGYRCKLKQRFVDVDDFCKRGERGKE